MSNHFIEGHMYYVQGHSLLTKKTFFLSFELDNDEEARKKWREWLKEKLTNHMGHPLEFALLFRFLGKDPVKPVDFHRVPVYLESFSL